MQMRVSIGMHVIVPIVLVVLRVLFHRLALIMRMLAVHDVGGHKMVNES